MMIPASTRHAAVFAMVVTAASCHLGSHLLPKDAQPFAPPPVYQTWWQLVRSCSGSTAAFESVTWLRVPGPTVSVEGRRANAFWIGRGNQIVISGDHVLSGDLIRHEMLHAQLGVPSHPRSQFLGECAGVVACSQECVEGQMTIPEGLVRAPVESLSVGVSVDPQTPSASSPDGHFMVRVSATNASPLPILIEAPTGEPVARGFGFDLRGPEGGRAESQSVIDLSSILFAPGETKYYLFDFFIGRSPTQYVNVGEFLLFGTFDHARSAALEVRIGP